MIQVAPIQIQDNGILIPLDYFNNSKELELIIEGMFARIRVRAKQRIAGLHQGAMIMADDFDAPILDLFGLEDE